MKVSAKTPKRKKQASEANKALDTILRKRPRGRPGVRTSEIRGRADNYRVQLGEIWRNVGEALLKAKTKEDVEQAFDPWPSYENEFAPIAPLILKVLHEPRFPKRRGPQINFLADSLAGRGLISPRRSRDICEQERNKRVNYIIRQDYYIECTCRYKGPALHGKCPKCGADKLKLPYIPWLGP